MTQKLYSYNTISRQSNNTSIDWALAYLPEHNKKSVK